MKSNCVSQRPSPFIDLGNGRFHYNYDVVEGTKESENGEPVVSFDYDTAEILGIPNYSKTVSAVIRNKYTADKEIALINGYNRYKIASTADRDPNDLAEYKAYLDEVEEIKAKVKSDIIAAGYEVDD